MIPGTDLSIGQLVTLAICVFTCVNAVMTGAAVRNGRATLRAIGRLVASVGHPAHQPHREGLTLTAQVEHLAGEWEWFKEKYKRDMDNMRSQQLYEQAGRITGDESPVRDGYENTTQKRRH